MNNKTTIAVYIRTAGQDDGFAYERQLRKAKTMADKLNLEPDFKVFSDIGVSDIVPYEKREGLYNCLQFINRNKIPYLFVVDISRLARDTSEYFRILQFIPKDTRIFAHPGEEIGYGSECTTMLLSLYEGLQSQITKNIK